MFRLWAAVETFVVLLITTGLDLIRISPWSHYGVDARQLPNLHWNSSSAFFYPRDADHTIDVSIKDRLHIFCPHYSKAVDMNETEVFIIYQVNRRDMNQCSTGRPLRELFRCSKPYTREPPFSVTFRRFTANPSALVFQPGKDYYFISTSTGSFEGLENPHGGLCAENGMRLRIHVRSTRRKSHPKLPLMPGQPDFDNPISQHRGRHQQTPLMIPPLFPSPSGDAHPVNQRPSDFEDQFNDNNYPLRQGQGHSRRRTQSPRRNALAPTTRPNGPQPFSDAYGLQQIEFSIEYADSDKPQTSGASGSVRVAEVPTYQPFICDALLRFHVFQCHNSYLLISSLIFLLPKFLAKFTE